MIKLSRAEELINTAPAMAEKSELQKETLLRLLVNRPFFKKMLGKPELFQQLLKLFPYTDVQEELTREYDKLVRTHSVPAAEFILGSLDAQAVMEEKLKEIKAGD